LKMNKHSFLLMVISTFSTIITSCNNKENKEEVKTDTTVLQKDTIKNKYTNVAIVPKPKDSLTLKENNDTAALAKMQQKATFIFETREDDTYPKSKIFVSINGKKVFIKEVTGEAGFIEKEGSQYVKYFKLPKNTIAACQSWYGGAGDYYYMVPSKTGITVFQGWMDSQQEDDGYHWEKYKEIAAK
jgi:hypothetical protein